MLSSLRELEYQMLGDIEIRKADWLRIRVQGPFRFAVSCCRSSFSGRIGALLMLSSLEGVRGLHAIDGLAWFLLTLGTFGVCLSLLYGWRAWFQMERIFSARAPQLSSEMTISLSTSRGTSRSGGTCSSSARTRLLEGGRCRLFAIVRLR